MTDYSNASRTMLFNINTLQWDDEILEELEYSEIACCQTPKPSSCVYGEADPTFFGGADSDCRCSRRPAGGAVRTDLFSGRVRPRIPMAQAVFFL